MVLPGCFSIAAPTGIRAYEEDPSRFQYPVALLQSHKVAIRKGKVLKNVQTGNEIKAAIRKRQG
jgi:hypothetical protein